MIVLSAEERNHLMTLIIDYGLEMLEVGEGVADRGEAVDTLSAINDLLFKRGEEE